MYKEVLRAIDGISIYPVISLALFFIIFTFLIIRVARYDKKLLGYMSNMPLGNDENSQSSNR